MSSYTQRRSSATSVQLCARRRLAVGSDGARAADRLRATPQRREHSPERPRARALLRLSRRPPRATPVARIGRGCRHGQPRRAAARALVETRVEHRLSVLHQPAPSGLAHGPQVDHGVGQFRVRGQLCMLVLGGGAICDMPACKDQTSVPVAALAQRCEERNCERSVLMPVVGAKAEQEGARAGCRRAIRIAVCGAPTAHPHRSPSRRRGTRRSDPPVSHPGVAWREKKTARPRRQFEPVACR